NNCPTNNCSTNNCPTNNCSTNNCPTNNNTFLKNVVSFLNNNTNQNVTQTGITTGVPIIGVTSTNTTFINKAKEKNKNDNLPESLTCEGNKSNILSNNFENNCSYIQNKIEPKIPSIYYCRVCLCEYENKNNPLICPCKCKGSLKYIHLFCLRTWMRGRLNIRNEYSSYAFFWTQLNCELCKFPYPTYIYVQNKFVQLYELPKPDFPYIIIELISDKTKGFYVVSLANTKSVRMGRGHDSDIRVNDISVSRFHALIKLHNGNFYIEDCKSKFGTLIQIRKPVFFNIRRNKFIALQIGGTVMYVYMKRKNWMFLPICLKLSKTTDEDVSTLDNCSSKTLMDNNNNNTFTYNSASGNHARSSNSSGNNASGDNIVNNNNNNS
ncbi:FHA domain protein, putative, partial [Hepatocystis sp. ex Piliocolobus tephrosceles]